MNSNPGNDALETWFELSYASWLALPRVLMEQMPDEWQGKMAALLTEFSDHYRTLNDHLDHVTIKVQLADPSGRFIKTPEWLINYRHPDYRTLKLLMEEKL